MLNASAKNKYLQLVDVSLVIELQLFFFLSFLGLFCSPLVTCREFETFFNFFLYFKIFICGLMSQLQLKAGSEIFKI